MKLILSISSNCVLTVINASAAVTLLEQRPENISSSEPEIFTGLCSSSVTAALASMTVITQLLLWDKLLSQIQTLYFLPTCMHISDVRPPIFSWVCFLLSKQPGHGAKDVFVSSRFENPLSRKTVLSTVFNSKHKI